MAAQASQQDRHHPELPIGRALASLIAQCESVCVAECCGLGAFDFSPLRVAASLTKYGGPNADHVQAIRDDLDALIEAGKAYPGDDAGCSTDLLNADFSNETLEQFVRTIQIGLDSLDQMVAASDELVRKHTA